VLVLVMIRPAAQARQQEESVPVRLGTLFGDWLCAKSFREAHQHAQGRERKNGASYRRHFATPSTPRNDDSRHCPALLLLLIQTRLWSDLLVHGVARGLEEELQRKLNLPFREHGVRGNTEIGRTQDCARNIERVLIKKVEELSSKLQC